MKKLVFYLLVLLFVAVTAAVWVMKKMPYFAPVPYGNGDLFFPQNPNLSGITVWAGGKEIKLRKVDGNWQADAYFASNSLVEGFLQNLYEAEIIKSDEDAGGDQQQILLILDGKDDFRFGVRKSENNKYCIVNREGRKLLINRNLLLPEDVAEYYVQPLLNLGGRQIEQVIGYNGPVTELINLRYLGAARKLPAETAARRFVLVTADGIKVFYHLYKQQDRYWIAVRFKATILPTNDAAAYIDTNSFRYEGWYFRLSAEDGNRLYQNADNF